MVGVDLGKSVDSTVVAVVEYHLTGTGEFDVREGSQGVVILNERYREHYDVRDLQRIKLQTSYDEIIAHLDRLMAREPLLDADMVFDSTAAGIVFGDMLESQTSLRFVSHTISQTLRYCAARLKHSCAASRLLEKAHFQQR